MRNFTCFCGETNRKSLSTENISRLDREFLENGSKKLTKLFAAIFFLFLIGVGNVWGGTTSYPSRTSAGTDSKNIESTDSWVASLGASYNASGAYWACNQTTRTVTITCTNISDPITEIVVSGKRNYDFAYSISATVGGSSFGTTYSHAASSGNYTTNTLSNATGMSGTVVLTITSAGATSKGGSIWVGSITVTTKSSCSANPSIGAASLNGTFNLTTVGVQCASITPGTSCSVASGDYGFIWYANDGTKKEIGGTGVTKVAVTSGAYSSGSFSANISSTFVLGNRYSVRAFATNGKPATVYSDTITFQPRSVTFNLNGHGSSTPSTQYVNNGGKATNPSYSESVTGYTFGGWYKEAGCSNSWTFGTDVVSGANKTLYAKWTPNDYTIELDQDLTPTSAGTTSISVTYNANTNLTSAITKPTKTGWTFAGYYTAKNGGGTQIIDADGNVLASKDGYTDGSKNWIGTSDVTLYAKWTCTVTWSVSGATDVYDAHTLTYNGTSTKIASVPGPPSPASYCGDKFVGWTSVENYVHGTSNLFTTVAGSPELKTIGDITFYAVFADYDE